MSQIHSPSSVICVVESNSQKLTAAQINKEIAISVLPHTLVDQKDQQDLEDLGVQDHPIYHNQSVMNYSYFIFIGTSKNTHIFC